MRTETIDDAHTRRWLQLLETKASLSPMAFPAYGGTYGSGGMGGYGDMGSSWFSNYLPGAHRDYAAEAGDLWLNSAVASCIGWINDNFDEPPIEVAVQTEDKEVEPVPNEQFKELMAEPNPDYDGSSLWGATNLSWLVSGNAYWMKAKARGGQRMFLYWVPHWEMEPRWKPDGTQFIDHYDHIVDGKRIPVARENVIHFRRGLNPVNVRMGLPTLEPALREICTDNSAASYTAAICRNWGVVRVLLTPDGDGVQISDEEAENMKSLWQERSTAENVGMPLINSGRLKVQELSAKPRDMALGELRSYPEARICAQLRIDPMVIGLSVGTGTRTFSNLAVAERMSYRNCLIPLQKRHCKTLTRNLLPDLGGRPGQFVRFDLSAVEALQEEAMSLATRMALLVKGEIIAVNEARAKLGFAPVEGGEYEDIAKKKLAEQQAMMNDPTENDPTADEPPAE